MAPMGCPLPPPPPRGGALGVAQGWAEKRKIKKKKKEK